MWRIINFIANLLLIPISYASYCGQTQFNGTTGTILSPSYPDNYPKSSFCIYYIEPLNIPENYRIIFTFTMIDIPSKPARNDETACTTDYVKFTEKNGAVELAKFCNNNKPDHKIISHFNEAHVVFDSNADRDVGQGFVIEYEVAPESDIDLCSDDEFRCGNLYTDEPECRPRSDICNGEVNCYDGMDENDCDLKCGGTIVIRVRQMAPNRVKIRG